MKSPLSAGICQLDNGCFGYRYTITVDGKRKDIKRTTTPGRRSEPKKRQYVQEQRQ